MRTMLLALLAGATALSPALAQEERQDQQAQDAQGGEGERAEPAGARSEVVNRWRERAQAQAARREARESGNGGGSQMTSPRRPRTPGDAHQDSFRRDDRPNVDRHDRRADRRDGTFRDDRHSDARADRRDGDWRNDRRLDRRADRGWDGNWRDDRRYDWRQNRERYGGVYRLPRYYDPFGDAYGYRRYSPGFRLGPAYFGQRYWIADPWRYRLPEVWGPYRWVRYYDDALLVDLYSGRVVDVIHRFFW